MNIVKKKNTNSFFKLIIKNIIKKYSYKLIFVLCLFLICRTPVYIMKLINKSAYFKGLQQLLNQFEITTTPI